MRRPPAEETVSCRGGLLLRRPLAGEETASCNLYILYSIIFYISCILTSVLVEASAMMACGGDAPPPPGKGIGKERDFRPDFDDDDEDELPDSLHKPSLRLHVHFSF